MSLDCILRGRSWESMLPRHRAEDVSALSSLEAESVIDGLKSVGFSTNRELGYCEQEIILLKVISLLHSQSIDENILTQTLQDLLRRQGLRIEGYLNSKEEYYLARRALQHKSIVYTVEPDTIHVHPAMTEAVGDRILEENEFSKWFQISNVLVSLSFPYSSIDAVGPLYRYERREQCKKLMRHIFELAGTYHALDDQRGLLQLASVSALEFAKLLNGAGEHLVQISYPLDAKYLLDLAESIVFELERSPAAIAFGDQIKDTSALISANQMWMSILLGDIGPAVTLVKQRGEFEGQPDNERLQSSQAHAMALYDSGIAQVVIWEYDDAVETLSAAAKELHDAGHSTSDLECSIKYHIALALYRNNKDPEFVGQLYIELLNIDNDNHRGINPISIWFGKLIYACANFHNSQYTSSGGPTRLLNETSKLYASSVIYLMQTVGPDHHLTARACIRYAQFLVRQGHDEMAQLNLDQALCALEPRHRDGLASGYRLYHLPELVCAYHTYSLVSTLEERKKNEMRIRSVNAFNAFMEETSNSIRRSTDGSLEEDDLDFDIYEF